MSKSFEELLNQENKKSKTLSVVAANDIETISACVRAKKLGFIEPIFIGNQNKMIELIESLDEDSQDYQLIHSEDDQNSAKIGVKLIKENKAEFLMKGYLNTSTLLSQVVNKETGIMKQGELLSHINYMDLPGINKSFILTDVGVNIKPKLAQKVKIVENAVEVMNRLGNHSPNVAILSAVETVNPKMEETLDAAELVKLNEEQVIKNCHIEGPISFDIAMSKKIADKKRYEGTIAGEADILVVPDLASGNMLAKSLGMFGKAKAVAFVTGGQVPIVLTSRGTSAEGKFKSIVLCSSLV